MDPRREEAAAALGATPLQVLRTVTLPALRPVVLSAASVVFLFCATAFGVVLTLGGVRYATVETEIYLLTTQFLDLRAAAALSVLQIVVVVALLVVTGRDPGRGAASSVERVARRTAARRPRRSDLPAARPSSASCWCWSLAPLATLVVRSLRVDGALVARSTTGRWATPTRRPPSPSRSATALENSLRVAVDATLLALTLGLVVAVLVTRRTQPAGPAAAARPLRRHLHAPAGRLRGHRRLRAPGHARPAAARLPGQPVAGAGRAGDGRAAPGGPHRRPRSCAASTSGGARPPPRSGPSPLRVLATVDLPVAWRPVLAATGFAFAVSLGEFGATSFLARPDAPTLPVLVYQLVSRPGADNFGMALAASVVLGLVTALVMLVRRAAPRRAAWEPSDVLETSHLTVTFGDTVAVDDVSLELPTGEVLAVLGASGCGKSTLLRAVAGLERPDDGLGALRRRGRDPAARPPPRLRADVPGRPAVPEPLGRRQRRLPAPAPTTPRAPSGERRVAELLELVGLPGLRRPRRRAPCPAASSSGWRWPGRWRCGPGCCCSTSRCPRSTATCASGWPSSCTTSCRVEGTTALLVTHDHDEAFAVADRMAVMRAGRLVQSGTLEEVWRRPADAETARFLGYAAVVTGPSAQNRLLGRRRGRASGGDRAAPVRAPGRRRRPALGRGRLRPGSSSEQTRLVVDVDGGRARSTPSPGVGRGAARRGSGSGSGWTRAGWRSWTTRP